MLRIIQKETAEQENTALVHRYRIVLNSQVTGLWCMNTHLQLNSLVFVPALFRYYFGIVSSKSENRFCSAFDGSNEGKNTVIQWLS